MRNITAHLINLLLAVLLTACFTGVESTKKITAKDVAKALETSKDDGSSSFFNIQCDSFPAWHVGKAFYVTDNNVRVIFSASPLYDLSAINLRGATLVFRGYSIGSVLDNRKTVNIRLSDGKNEYIYPTDKTFDELAKMKSDFSIPMLIDLDLVQNAKKLLIGDEFFIRTSIWYDSIDNMTSGKKFVKVKIDDILPGDKVFPFKVKFTDSEGKVAYVFMSSSNSPVQNRQFDKLFSITDPHKNFPSITDEHWKLITEGKIVNYMTKDECRLALGAPNSIDSRPGYEGVKEYWTYDNGIYLVFSDGLLTNFRR
jgi:hypothetical protein